MVGVYASIIHITTRPTLAARIILFNNNYNIIDMCLYPAKNVCSLVINTHTNLCLVEKITYIVTMRNDKPDQLSPSLKGIFI